MERRVGKHLIHTQFFLLLEAYDEDIQSQASSPSTSKSQKRSHQEQSDESSAPITPKKKRKTDATLARELKKIKKHLFRE